MQCKKKKINLKCNEFFCHLNVKEGSSTYSKLEPDSGNVGIGLAYFFAIAPLDILQTGLINYSKLAMYGKLRDIDVCIRHCLRGCIRHD